MFKFGLTICLLIFLTGCADGCKSCKREKDPEVIVKSGGFELEFQEEEYEKVEEKKGPKIRHIYIGPSEKGEEYYADTEATGEKTSPPEDADLPPNTKVESDLSARLRDKMLDAYGEDADIPDVKIYLSDMKFGDFVDYYGRLGYNVRTVSVPASQVIEPVLAQRPELADKINIEDYENITINQIVVDGAGISAADKYIDPDTFEVIDKTFVTRMNK